MTGPSEQDQALRDRIKTAIQTAQDSEGRLLYVIPPGVAGMYADAIMRVLTEQPYPYPERDPMNDPTPDRSPLGRLRDRIAWAVACFALTVIATPWYSKMIRGLVRYGMAAAAKETR